MSKVFDNSSAERGRVSIEPPRVGNQHFMSGFGKVKDEHQLGDTGFRRGRAFGESALFHPDGTCLRPSEINWIIRVQDDDGHSQYELPAMGRSSTNPAEIYPINQRYIDTITNEIKTDVRAFIRGRTLKLEQPELIPDRDILIVARPSDWRSERAKVIVSKFLSATSSFGAVSMDTEASYDNAPYPCRPDPYERATSKDLSICAAGRRRPHLKCGWLILTSADLSTIIISLAYGYQGILSEIIHVLKSSQLMFLGQGAIAEMHAFGMRGSYIPTAMFIDSVMNDDTNVFGNKRSFEDIRQYGIQGQAFVVYGEAHKPFKAPKGTERSDDNLFRSRRDLLRQYGLDPTIQNIMPLTEFRRVERMYHFELSVYGPQICYMANDGWVPMCLMLLRASMFDELFEHAAAIPSNIQQWLSRSVPPQRKVKGEFGRFDNRSPSEMSPRCRAMLEAGRISIEGAPVDDIAKPPPSFNFNSFEPITIEYGPEDLLLDYDEYDCVDGSKKKKRKQHKLPLFTRCVNASCGDWEYGEEHYDEIALEIKKDHEKHQKQMEERSKITQEELDAWYALDLTGKKKETSSPPAKQTKRSDSPPQTSSGASEKSVKSTIHLPTSPKPSIKSTIHIPSPPRPKIKSVVNVPSPEKPKISSIVVIPNKNKIESNPVEIEHVVEDPATMNDQNENIDNEYEMQDDHDVQPNPIPYDPFILDRIDVPRPLPLPDFELVMPGMPRFNDIPVEDRKRWINETEVRVNQIENEAVRLKFMSERKWKVFYWEYQKARLNLRKKDDEMRAKLVQRFKNEIRRLYGHPEV